MNLYQFLGLDLNDKAAYVPGGKYLATRITKHMSVLLYGFDDFYAEVFYDLKKNKITDIRGFRSRSLLIPYTGLQRITSSPENHRS